MHAFDKQFPITDIAPRIFEVDAALTERFYFCSNQGDSRLICLLDEVVMIRFFIVCNNFYAIRHGCVTSFSRMFSALPLQFASAL